MIAVPVNVLNARFLVENGCQPLFLNDRKNLVVGEHARGSRAGPWLCATPELATRSVAACALQREGSPIEGEAENDLMSGDVVSPEQIQAVPNL